MNKSNRENTGQRIDNLTLLLAELETELAQYRSEFEIAPNCSWITRYQARGQKKYYWYYKWQATCSGLQKLEPRLAKTRFFGSD